MKKFFALTFVAAAIAFTGCAEETTQVETVEPPVIEEPLPEPMPMPADTMMMDDTTMVDTTEVM